MPRCFLKLAQDHHGVFGIDDDAPEDDVHVHEPLAVEKSSTICLVRLACGAWKAPLNPLFRLPFDLRSIVQHHNLIHHHNVVQHQHGAVVNGSNELHADPHPLFFSSPCSEALGLIALTLPPVPAPHEGCLCLPQGWYPDPCTSYGSHLSHWRRQRRCCLGYAFFISC
jgi:hypothetical protein